MEGDDGGVTLRGRTLSHPHLRRRRHGRETLDREKNSKFSSTASQRESGELQSRRRETSQQQQQQQEEKEDEATTARKRIHNNSNNGSRI